MIPQGYMICSSCRGTGMGYVGHYGSVGDCWYCEGGGLVRKRDSKGRFCK